MRRFNGNVVKKCKNGRKNQQIVTNNASLRDKMYQNELRIG